MSVTASAPPVPRRVSTLELFFDLVFVFTITQVSTIIVRSPNGPGVARAFVELAVIFWMYGGYAWLTNVRPPDTVAQRLLLLASMAAFFVVSLSVPDAFGINGIAFGVAYLVINLLHSLGFVIFGRGALPAAGRLLAFNLVSATLILAAGWTHGTADWVLWLAALAVQWVTPAFTAARASFRIDAAHFAERHGLVVLIVLGESLVSIGISGAHERITLRVVIGVIAGLLALATMWWVYFVGDDERAAEAMDAAPPAERPTMAITGYFAAHLIMIFGVIMLAAGARLSASDLTSVPAEADSAWLLAAGGGAYLAGSAAFRVALGFATAWGRGAGAVMCLAAVPIGTRISGAAELVAVAVVMAAAMAIDRLSATAVRSGESAPAPEPAGRPTRP